MWTAPAFDRCLLLALIYPIVTIFILWAISGHVGPAEAALGLQPETSSWLRGLATAAIGFSSFAFLRFELRDGNPVFGLLSLSRVLAVALELALEPAASLLQSLVQSPLLSRVLSVSLSGCRRWRCHHRDRCALSLFLPLCWRQRLAIRPPLAWTSRTWPSWAPFGALRFGIPAGAIAFAVAIVLIGAVAAAFASTGTVSDTGSGVGAGAVAGAVTFAIAIAFNGGSLSGSRVAVAIAVVIVGAMAGAIAVAALWLSLH